MRRKSNKVVSKFILIMLIVGFTSLQPIIPAEALGNPRIYLEPSSILYTPSDASVGTLFNVTVKVEDVSDLACFEVKMYYDDSMINVTCWYEPTDDPGHIFHGENTMPVPSPPDYYYRHDDPCSGSANVGSSMFPAPSPGDGFTGSGTLMIFEFEITSVPTTGTYSCPLQIDNGDTYLLNSAGDEISGVTKENGYYEFRSGETPPTGTRLYVDPPEIIDPTMTPSSTFSINVVIDDVENMRVCEFKIPYNRSILGWFGINVHRVQGEIPSSSMDAKDEVGYIWVKLIYSTSVSTSVPIQLVKINFHVKAMGATTLDLLETELLDPAGQPISHEAIGSFFMTQMRDIAIINVTVSQNWTYPHRLVNITVTAKNLGNESETFNISIYVDDTLLETVNVVDLNAGTEFFTVIVWNTSATEPCHDYIIRAEASTLPNELNIINNIFIDGIIDVYYLGDVNIDGNVNMTDLYIGIQAFASYPGHSRWNPNADIDQNKKIDMRDIQKVIQNFGQTC